MANNFFTISKDILDAASYLAAKDYEELNGTTSYKNADVLVVNGSTKQYWVTTSKTISNCKSFIKSTGSTLTKNITLKDIKQWQEK